MISGFPEHLYLWNFHISRISVILHFQKCGNSKLPEIPYFQKIWKWCMFVDINQSVCLNLFIYLCLHLFSVYLSLSLSSPSTQTNRHTNDTACVCTYICYQTCLILCMYVCITVGGGSGSGVYSVSTSVHIYSSFRVVLVWGLLHLLLYLWFCSTWSQFLG